MNSSDQQALMAFANQHRGDLDGLLKNFFHFLHTYTDLYVVDAEPGRMGFKPGEAQAKVVAAFQSFPYKETEARRAAPSAKTSGNADSERPSSASTKTKSHVETVGVRPPVGNGGAGPGYVWTQTLSEVNVYVAVPAGTRAKDLDVDITASIVRVVHRTQTKALLLEGTMAEVVNATESTWTLEGSTIMLILVKRREVWWSCVVKGHPEIDTTKVDSTRRVEEYDPETQAAIRKLVVEQQAKQQTT